ncbi:hypothetical protein EV126DRAFT_68123 [Verticillium dahliae]|nr:hypothetical protein EV126DRAFT_68123 [Verticillium dahliae]
MGEALSFRPLSIVLATHGMSSLPIEAGKPPRFTIVNIEWSNPFFFFPCRHGETVDQTRSCCGERSQQGRKENMADQGRHWLDWSHRIGRAKEGRPKEGRPKEGRPKEGRPKESSQVRQELDRAHDLSMNGWRHRTTKRDGANGRYLVDGASEVRPKRKRGSVGPRVSIICDNACCACWR